MNSRSKKIFAKGGRSRHRCDYVIRDTKPLKQP